MKNKTFLDQDRIVFNYRGFNIEYRFRQRMIFINRKNPHFQFEGCKVDNVFFNKKSIVIERFSDKPERTTINIDTNKK